MNPVELAGRQRGRPSRRTVRIVKPKAGSRTATISLLVASCACILLFAVWRLWSNGESLTPPQRGPQDVTLEWQCEDGHRFYETGQYEPRACLECGLPAYPVDRYVCPVHGEFEVLVRFSRMDQRAVVSELRVETGDPASRQWVFAQPGPICPKCGRTLTRPPPDPLKNYIDRQKRTRP